MMPANSEPAGLRMASMSSVEDRWDRGLLAEGFKLYEIRTFSRQQEEQAH